MKTKLPRISEAILLRATAKNDIIKLWTYFPSLLSISLSPERFMR